MIRLAGPQRNQDFQEHVYILQRLDHAVSYTSTNTLQHLEAPESFVSHHQVNSQQHTYSTARLRFSLVAVRDVVTRLERAPPWRLY